jgi:glycosyltransferase involved in cell wall biosynthesis
LKKPDSSPSHAPRVLLTDENKGFGGAERHVLTLAGELRKSEALDALIARPKSWLAQNIGDLPFHPVGFRNEVDMLSVFSIYRRLKSTGATVLHCIGHRDLVASALARQLPGAPKTVLLKAEHSYPDANLSPLFRWAYGQCQAVTAVSDALLDSVRKTISVGENTRFVTVHNGLCTDSVLEPNRPPDGRPLRIGVLSPLRPEKGHEDFLQAAAKLREQEDVSVQLSLAGGGELEQDLREQATAKGLEVEFLGHIEEPSEYLKGLDLSVVPSHRETFSLVTLESMFAGRPIVAANSAGVEEICRDYPARLYPVGDVEALYQALLEFCRNPSVLQEKAFSAAHSARETFDSSRMRENYEKLYQELLGSFP